MPGPTLAGAAYMTALERNGDVVRLASLRAAAGEAGPHAMATGPDLLRQHEDSAHGELPRATDVHAERGDVLLPVTVGATNIAASCVRDTGTGDVILKLVNTSAVAVAATVDLSSIAKPKPEATRIVPAGELGAQNTFETPDQVTPRTEPF